MPFISFDWVVTYVNLKTKEKSSWWGRLWELFITEFKGGLHVDTIFPKRFSLFLSYLQEISLNPKMLSKDQSASSHKSERIFSRFLN